MHICFVCELKRHVFALSATGSTCLLFWWHRNNPCLLLCRFLQCTPSLRDGLWAELAVVVSCGVFGLDVWLECILATAHMNLIC